MKKIHKDLPTDYSVCLHHDCQMAATCLHQLAYSKLIETERMLNLINPKHCSQDAACKHYRDNAPVVYAYGFTNFQKRMYPAQYKRFMHDMIRHFGRTSYFERRRGDYALPPNEQEVILKALCGVGITEEMSFDCYEEQISWYD